MVYIVTIFYYYYKKSDTVIILITNEYSIRDFPEFKRELNKYSFFEDFGNKPISELLCI